MLDRHSCDPATFEIVARTHEPIVLGNFMYDAVADGDISVVEFSREE